MTKFEKEIYTYLKLCSSKIHSRIKNFENNISTIIGFLESDELALCSSSDELNFRNQLESITKRCQNNLAEAKAIFKENLIAALFIVYNLKI